MKKFLLGLVAGVVLCGLGAIIVVLVLVRFASSLSERPPAIADNSTLVFNLEGDVPEQAPTEYPIPFLEQQSPLTVHQVWLNLRKAAADSRIKAVLFRPRNLSLGWARMQEIHEELVQFKKSGKPLIASLRAPGTHEYYLATAADRIFMDPMDTLDVKGLAIEPVFFKGALDKIGAEVDVEHAGKYKDAGDMFTRTSMTPETREVLNNVLDQYFGDLVNVIASGRKKQPDDVRAMIDHGPFMSEQARAYGLVDQLAYEDQVEGYLRSKLNESRLNKITVRSYVRVPGNSLHVEGGRRIALIVGEGEITRGSDNSATFGNDTGITATKFVKLLNQVENDNSIKGAILRIDSPGGDGVASDDILNAEKSLSHRKPIVISMGDYAASGGYFMSITGDRIIAYPNTLTGSIGVIFGKLNLRGLYNKLGVQKDLLTRGRYADLYSDYVPLSEDARAKLDEQVAEFYHAFIDRVAAGRKKPASAIEQLAQGRVWLGTQAKANGLVDELGGLDRAVQLIKQRASIPQSEQVTLVPFPPKQTIFEKLMTRQDENTALESAVSKVLGGVPIRAWVDGGFLEVMPYSIRVR